MKTSDRRSNGIERCMRLPLLTMLVAGILACTPQLSLRADQTVGEQFREVMARIDTDCRERKLGPYEPEPRQKGVRNASCDILFLKPQDPLSTPEGRFAHAIKLPAPHDVPKDVWRAGMTGEEYFQALCEAEAGEWVFRTVERVEGIRQVRPYHKTNYYEMLGTYYAAEIAVGDLVAHVENPAGYLIASDVKQWLTYQYLEIPPAGFLDNNRFRRYFKDPSAVQGPPAYGVSVIENVMPKSRFGYAWRGIERVHARESGILGSELIVLDLDTNEVLAYRRHFYRFYFKSTYRDPRQMFASICRSKTFDSGFAFITRVIQPVKGEGK